MHALYEGVGEGEEQAQPPSWRRMLGAFHSEEVTAFHSASEPENDSKVLHLEAEIKALRAKLEKSSSAGGELKLCGKVQVSWGRFEASWNSQK